MRVRLRMTGRQHRELAAHLFPGDGAEAVAFALCGRHVTSSETILLVQRFHLVPYDQCRRERDLLEWSTDALEPVLAAAAHHGLSLLKVHSHPGGFEDFSAADDDSDAEVFAAVHNWTRAPHAHASAIMLPGGRMFGRAFASGGELGPLERIAVAGDDLHFWDCAKRPAEVPEFARRSSQLFGSGTTNLLRRLSVAVVGASGTGSPVIEQLGRYGVGKLTIVEPQAVEEVNLGRILNAWREDAERGTSKLEVQARALRRMDLGTHVEILPAELCTTGTRETIRAIAGCDVVFGCVDSIEGRHLLSLISTHYLVPYFDVGVHITADGTGGVEEVSGAVHYIQPDGATLLGREAYSLKALEAELLARRNPEEFERRKRDGYLHAVGGERPAVISLNMNLSSQAVLELLARLHPFRARPNREFAIIEVDLLNGRLFPQREPAVPCEFAAYLGRGDSEPLLGIATLRRPP
jgi:ThiF family protein/JAB domain-containing protein similar to deubiquitination enzymes